MMQDEGWSAHPPTHLILAFATLQCEYSSTYHLHHCPIQEALSPDTGTKFSHSEASGHRRLSELVQVGKKKKE